MWLRAGWPFLVVATLFLAVAVFAYLSWPLGDPCALVDVMTPATPTQKAAYAARCAPVRPPAGWVLPAFLAACGLVTGGLGLLRPRS